MEAAGIEPASSGISTKASTYLAGCLSFAPEVSNRRDSPAAIFVRFRFQPPKRKLNPIPLTGVIPSPAGEDPDDVAALRSQGKRFVCVCV